MLCCQRLTRSTGRHVLSLVRRCNISVGYSRAQVPYCILVWNRGIALFTKASAWKTELLDVQFWRKQYVAAGRHSLP